MNMTIDKTELSNYLSEAGCCQMCVLRFLKPRMNDFLNADESLKKVMKSINAKFINT